MLLDTTSPTCICFLGFVSGAPMGQLHMRQGAPAGSDSICTQRSELGSHECDGAIHLHRPLQLGPASSTCMLDLLGRTNDQLHATTIRVFNPTTTIRQHLRRAYHVDVYTVVPVITSKVKISGVL
jgi:hypothetical protein